MSYILKNQLIESKKFITEDELFELFTIAQSFLVPIAINFAVIFGNKFAGFSNISLIVLGTITPQFFVIIIFVDFLLKPKDNRFITYFFKGIRIATIAILTNISISFICKKKYNISIVFLIFYFFYILFDKYWTIKI